MQIIAQLLRDDEAKQTLAYIDQQASCGLRALAVANSSDGGKTWALFGLISMLDPPREDSAETIKEAQSLGVEVKMITGRRLRLLILAPDFCLIHASHAWKCCLLQDRCCDSCTNTSAKLTVRGSQIVMASSSVSIKAALQSVKKLGSCLHRSHCKLLVVGDAGVHLPASVQSLRC